MPDRVKDDRPYSDRITEFFSNKSDAHMRKDAGMPVFTRDDDVQLGPRKGVMEGLKKAGEGYKTLKQKGLVK